MRDLHMYNHKYTTEQNQEWIKVLELLPTFITSCCGTHYYVMHQDNKFWIGTCMCIFECDYCGMKGCHRGTHPIENPIDEKLFHYHNIGSYCRSDPNIVREIEKRDKTLLKQYPLQQNKNRYDEFHKALKKSGRQIII